MNFVANAVERSEEHGEPRPPGGEVEKPCQNAEVDRVIELVEGWLQVEKRADALRVRR